MLEDKTIVLGVTGGIAAYKAVDAASRLQKLGAEVEVIMTEAAAEFVQPLTFRSITHRPVTVKMFDAPKNWDVEHISLADKADLFLVAPATANIIGKLANGIADDMLSTTLMAAKAEVILAPAMNVNMYENQIVQDNLAYLKNKGYKVITPDKGYLACGYEGRGRFPDPEEIVKICTAYLLNPDQDLTGRRVLVTAGGTQEALDPVRYIGNHSSGKMGYALARTALARGAEVTLVSAPTELNPPKGVDHIEIISAEEMYQEVKKRSSEQDIIIMAAAVADYSPKVTASNKIKKQEGKLVLELERTKDILASLGKEKDEGQVLVGFAAESTDLIKNAQKKLVDKNLDLIIANDITGSKTGFASDYNKGVIIGKNKQVEVTKTDKLKMAGKIFAEISKILPKEEM